MLAFYEFHKAYNGHTILRLPDFTINPGVYWIRGHNGAGKSTFLKTVAGILPFEGDITLDNQLTLKKHPTAYRSRVNFAEAEPIFPDFLTGTELIRLFKSAKQAPAQQEEQYVESMGMAPYVSDPISTYSSGMLKKLALVLAFLGRPRCILLDEPLTTLDADSLPVLFAWIAEQHQAGTMFLLSSHQELENDLLPNVRKIVVAGATLHHTV
ncbi:ATP-binding cassette domain-containing protein [Hymenobacter endophyticus]|uniref:ATP-binding cassette domain-containing protein n=1 Tax=Hymenobacter endophyticus TaxID=3076335 RepID=A0ABU3TBY2_9BACT|nr:ATP-binding cassette domain-containing protein [Hymenobacter endophyticus]MDU0368882.1 ATP-binding cassette domain-containing protein [Hymenobacter endophyticus]